MIIFGRSAYLFFLVILLSSAGCNGKQQEYRTDVVSRGDIRETVTATGTVNPVTTVLVGTQVSGTIRDIFADFNSPVKKGQVIAQIDPSMFEAQVAQARANAAKAEAGVRDTGRTRDRFRQLLARNLVAQSELDTAETNYESAAAQLEQATAALRLAETNLRYTRILSPVNGIVISRNVDVGQTVAASFQTPTLFTIAEDLTKMQINASVDEADIGKVRVGLAVEFTVDAFPNETFTGSVSQVRNAPTTVQNVVTYDVIVKVGNEDRRLKPGMTANVSIITAEKTGVLRVPAAALRFRPSGQKAADQKDAAVWMPEKGGPKRVAVTPGISDGAFVEVVAGELSENQQVIVETLRQKKDNGPARGGPRMF